MTPLFLTISETAWGSGLIIFAVGLFGVLLVIGAARLNDRDAQEDATFDTLRKPGMGDPRAVPPAVWAPNNPETWHHSAEPIYAELKEQWDRADNVCPSCALGKHALCTRALAPCDCPEHGRAG